jgi:hypothetical protein
VTRVKMHEERRSLTHTSGRTLQKYQHCKADVLQVTAIKKREEPCRLYTLPRGTGPAKNRCCEAGVLSCHVDVDTTMKEQLSIDDCWREKGGCGRSSSTYFM